MRLLQEIKPYLVWSFTPVLVILAGHLLFQLQAGHLGPLIAIALAALMVLVGASAALYWRAVYGRRNALNELARSAEFFQLRVSSREKEIESLILNLESMKVMQSNLPPKLRGLKVSIDKRDGKEFVFVYNVSPRRNLFDVFTLPLKAYFDLLVNLRRNATEDEMPRRITD